MGLHTHISQVGTKVDIFVSGEISSASVAQLEAIIEHFRHRGCSEITLRSGARRFSPIERVQDEVIAQARELASGIAIRR